MTAVCEHIIECLETGDGLVLPEGDQQIGKLVFRDRKLSYCLGQRHKNRVQRIAVVAGIQLPLPFIQQRQRCCRISDFIA